MALITFPFTPLPIRAEMYINGDWVDITSRIRSASDIIISGRGRQSEQGQPSTCTCLFTLNNRDAYFSTRVPTSVNYGLLGKNTPFRVGVTEDRSFALLDDTDTARVKTTDKAVLDTTDLDARIEFEPDNWTGRGSNGMLLCAKYRRTASANRSWAITVSASGYPMLWWSTDGATPTSVTHATPLPVQYGPIALRVTLDVDNGAAGHTITWYTSDTITGTWTQLGSPRTAAGTTTIFAGTADIELGRFDDGQQGGLAGIYGFRGRIYAFQLYGTIGGSLVANADIGAQARHSVLWSDGLGTPNTWTVEGSAEVTPDDFRFTGELAELPQRWDISGRDVYVPCVAADVTRRLGFANTPILSAQRRYFTAMVNDPVNTKITGYWPFEDGVNATHAAAVVPRTQPATVEHGTFGTVTDLKSTAGSVTIQSTSTRIYGTCQGTAYVSSSFLNFAFKMSSIPASSTTLIDIYCKGDIGRINISVTATTYDLAFYDPQDFLVGSKSTTFGGPTVEPDNWIMMRIQLTQSGATGQVDVGWYAPGDGVLYGMTATTFTGTAGDVTGFLIKGTTQNIGTQYAHVVAGNFFLDNSSAAYVTVMNAFAGETTTARWARVLAENGITGRIVGPASSEQMGPQPIAKAMDVLYEIADVEQGQIYPDRRSTDLVLRTHYSLLNQVGPSISYSGGELGNQVPQPTDDDRNLRNLVTATRSEGSSATVEVTDGVNGTDTVGVYETSIAREVYTDDRLRAQAGWWSFLGTWDEERWPLLRVDLERAPFTLSATKVRKGHQLARLDIGDIVTLTNLNQVGVAVDDKTVMIQGMTETLGNRKWQLAWNATPAGPFFVNDLKGTATSRQRAAATNSIIGLTINSTATTFVVTTTGKQWGNSYNKPGNFPMNVVVTERGQMSGEVMTIRAISSQGSMVVDDGTFENGVSGWTASANAAVAQSSVQAKSGTYSATLTVTSGTPTQVYARPGPGKAAPVLAGTSYTAEFWVYSPTAIGTMTVSIDWLDSGGGYLSTSATSAALTANVWTFRSFAATAPASAAFASYGPTIGGSPTVGTFIYFDNADFHYTTRTGLQQRFWVDARSVNGVVKSQPSGASVQVQNPFYVAFRGE